MDTFRTANQLGEDTERAIRSNNRLYLMECRDKLKGLVSYLEGRLTTADEQFSYVTDGVPWEQEFDHMPNQHVPLYLDLLHQYEQAHDAMTRAHTALNG